MHIHLSQPFHLDHTLNSGQVFRWHETTDGWEGIVNGNYIQISCNSSLSSNCSEEFVRHYFRLDDDLDYILSSVDRDSHIHRAITALHGLRIIRQDPWECLISFILSSFNNVPRIKLMVEALSREFGEPFDHGYAFPTPESLSRASLPQLRRCGLGYRDKYVLETARIIHSEYDLSELKSLPYEEARELLMKLPGVGSKVADCVLLFSLDKLESFPCDTNIQKCMTTYYGVVKDFNQFGREYFGEYAGYANHYLFHYYRSKVI